MRKNPTDNGDEIFLSYCSVSPLFPGGKEGAVRFLTDQSLLGYRMFQKYGNVLDPLHAAAAKLLRTAPENLSFLTNTSEGLNLIAAGYPITPGDRIISYVHEYPSNHYPWVIQQKRGAELHLLKNHNPTGIETPSAVAFDFEELERVATPNTKIVALSHVQFTSGFAASLREIGSFCKERGIDLVIDAAQSLGSMPLYPDEWNIAAVAVSGWKWLVGPIGSGLLYTSPEFREKIEPIMGGADLMKQGQDYLNHTWAPHSDGRKFEYSTLSLDLAVALTACIEQLFLNETPEAIFREILRLQDLALETLDRDRYTPLLFAPEHRSGILSLIPASGTVETVLRNAAEQKLFITSRGGYIRFAPHFFTTDEEIQRAVSILNGIKPD